MISNELRSIFAQAVSYAKSCKHEYLTLEHIFLMTLHDEVIESLLTNLGLNNDELFEKQKIFR